MKRYELGLKIIDEKYIDNLIISMVRQGYNVYYNDDEKVVCATITDDELIEIKERES